jgi:hypothetical protein
MRLLEGLTDGLGRSPSKALIHDQSSSALASLRTGESKPSVNTAPHSVTLSARTSSEDGTSVALDMRAKLNATDKPEN